MIDMRTREEIDKDFEVLDERRNLYAENAAMILIAEALFDIRDLLTSQKKPE